MLRGVRARAHAVTHRRRHSPASNAAPADAVPRPGVPVHSAHEKPRMERTSSATAPAVSPEVTTAFHTANQTNYVAPLPKSSSNSNQVVRGEDTIQGTATRFGDSALSNTRPVYRGMDQAEDMVKPERDAAAQGLPLSEANTRVELGLNNAVVDHDNTGLGTQPGDEDGVAPGVGSVRSLSIRSGSDAPVLRKVGMLSKYTNKFKGWRPRLFSLDAGLLTYVDVGSALGDSPTHEQLVAAADSLCAYATGSSGAHHHRGHRSRDALWRKHKVRRKVPVTGAHAAENGGTAGAGTITTKSHKDAAIDVEVDIRGVINIQFAAISPDFNDACRFAIDTGGEVYHVKAHSRQERDEWVETLDSSKRYFTALIQRAALRSSRSSRPSSAKRTTQASPSGGSDPKAASTPGIRAQPSPAALPPTQTLAKTAHTPSQSPHQRPLPTDTLPSALPERTTSPPAPRLPATHALLPNSLIPLASDSTAEESQPDDDGIAEAAQSKKALIVELRRLVQVLETGTAEDAFDDGVTQPVDVAGSVRDLAAWSLSVLQTQDMLFDCRVDAAVRNWSMSRSRTGGAISAYGDDDDDDDDDDEDLTARRRVAGVGRSGADEGGAMSAARLAGMGGDFDELDDYEEDDEDDEAEFYDALSRAASLASRATSSALPDAASEEVLPAATTLDTAAVNRPDRPRSRDRRGALARVDTKQISTVRGSMPRQRLPKLAVPPPKLNIWAILKDSVGKDLSKISMPVALNEPISFLQRLAEDIEYCELLDTAAEQTDPLRRLLYVAVMAVSHYSSTQGRTGKPFNPLLGETYSLVMPQKGKGVRFLAEQVSHHPPVSACYAEGTGASWKYYNAIEIKNKFWGKSLEVFPTGWNHVEIPKYNDMYDFKQVTACVHNIVVGKMWLDNYGEMEIVNRTTNDRCIINFHKSGWMTDIKSLGQLSGVVYDAAGSAKIKFSGRWPDAVYEDLKGKQRRLIWQAAKRPPLYASNNYNMTQWAIALNEPLAPNAVVAPSDSRHRPDQRALENGEYDYSGALKTALEEGQRARRREREEKGETWSPRWFTYQKHPATGRDEFLYNDKYFQATADGDWEQSPDLYSCAKSVQRSSS